MDKVAYYIDRDVTASYAEYPLNYHCPWSITSVIPNLYATSMSLMEEAADMLSNLSDMVKIAEKERPGMPIVLCTIPASANPACQAG